MTHLARPNGMPLAPSTKVLIFEPHAIGHHGPYLHWMATGLADRGFEVSIVTLQETMAHPSMRALAKTAFTEGAGSLQFIGVATPVVPLSGETGGTASLVTREQAYWRLFRAWYKAYANNIRPDVVFLPYLDYCLYAIGLFGSPFGDCPWVGLAMRPSFHYCAMDVLAPRPAFARLKKALFSRTLRNGYLRRLLTVDEPLANYLVDTQRASGKVAFFPEPAEFGELPARSEAKRKFGMAPERKLILLYGAVTARKGVVELLRALEAPGFPSVADVLLAGKVAEPAIRKLLAESWVCALRDQGRVKVIDRFIELEEEPALFAAADIVWVGYRGHYSSSGILAQAANVGRPLLACDEGVLGWQTRRHGLGRTVNPADTAEVNAAVDALLAEQLQKSVNNRSADAWRPPSFSVAQDALAHALTGA